MAMTTSTIVGLGLAAAAAGASAYNTRQTTKRQDQQAAEGIRRQGVRQREADAKVNEQVAELEQSTAAGAREQRLDEYLTGLRRNRAGMQSGLTPTIGSAAFRADSARAAGDVEGYAERAANLMSRIDAPAMQRQSEAFGAGNLATELGLIGRQSDGDDFMNRLRMSAIRRNPWIDAAASVAGSYGASMATRAPTGVEALNTTPNYVPVQQGGRAVYNTTPTRVGTWGVA